MRATRGPAFVFNNPILVGTVTILVVALAVYLSYIAANGLPFVGTYQVYAQVANADELFKNTDVRVGGARVGQVLVITPEPPSATWPHPFARLTLALNSNLGPLPPDTHYRIRLSSVLGGKYLEIIPGQVRTGRIPDGGTLTLSTNPATSHELPFVDLDTALGTFGPATRDALRSAIDQFGNVVAGRGNQFNDVLYALARALPPLERLLGVFVDPNNRLAELLTGGAQTTSALASVAPQLTDLLSATATTFDALRSSQLGSAIDQTAPTESVATGVLNSSLPALTEAATLTAGLRPATAILRLASTRLDQIIVAGTPIWGPVPALARDLRSALAAVQALARDPASVATFKALGSYDFATFGASANVGLGAILRAVAPAQFACNVAGLWQRNFASGLTEGDSSGSWLRAMPVSDSAQTTQAGSPAADLHLNYYPIENSSQCQAGNEGYSGAQLIGNPPRTGRTVDNTSPPPGVLAEGQKAGLVP
jgi:phospholipid/cholesterol/gamma-HCH transport system substrate-binding protein